jgi:hypothetical protein
VAAYLKAAGAREGLAEDQAGPVVESFEGLRIELVGGVLATGLGRRGIRRTPTHGLAENAVQPAARGELRLLGCISHRPSPFLCLLTI